MSYAKAEKEELKDIRDAIFDECEAKIVIAGVIGEYVLLNSVLTDLICRHIFRKKKYSSLRKTKAFRTFNAHFMEDASLLKKLNLV